MRQTSGRGYLFASRGPYFPIPTHRNSPSDLPDQSSLSFQWNEKDSFLSCLFFDSEVDVDFRFGWRRRRYPGVLKSNLFEKPKLTQPRQREGQK